MWLAGFTIVFAIRGFVRARDDQPDLARELGWATVYAAVAAAFFAPVQWLIFNV